MKLDLIILILIVHNSASGAFKCVDDASFSTSCLFDHFYPLNNGETRSVNVCLKPEITFQYLIISIVDADLSPNIELIQLNDELNRGYWNNILFKINKNQTDDFSPDLHVDIASENARFFGPLSAHSKELENAKSNLEFYFEGEWLGSREFVAEGIFDWTNCNQENEPTDTTPKNHLPVSSCKDDISRSEGVPFTLCNFENVDYPNVIKYPKWKICFKPKENFQYISASIITNGKERQPIGRLEAKSLQFHDWNQMFFPNKTDKSDIHLRNSLAKKNILEIIFYGAWEGQRDFHSEHDHEHDQYFSNCNRGSLPTQTSEPHLKTTSFPMTTEPRFLPVTGYPVVLVTKETAFTPVTKEYTPNYSIQYDTTAKTPSFIYVDTAYDGNAARSSYIIFIVGVVLLSLTTVACILVQSLQCHQTRKEKEIKQNISPAIHVTKFESNHRNKGKKGFRSYASNLSTDHPGNRNQGYKEAKEPYAAVDFEVVRNQEGKSIKEIVLYPRDGTVKHYNAKSSNKEDKAHNAIFASDATCNPER